MKYSPHVMTASALLVLYGASALSGCSGPIGSSASSPINTTSAGTKAAGPVIIDLRLVEEFKKGYLERAVNYDFSLGDFSSQISGLDRSSRYQFYGSVDQLRMANVVMRNVGFSSVIKLETLDAAKKTTGAKAVIDWGPPAQSPTAAFNMVLTVSVK